MPIYEVEVTGHLSTACFTVRANNPEQAYEKAWIEYEENLSGYYDGREIASHIVLPDDTTDIDIE